MTFRKGHKNHHDVSAAGRKGKQNSPWRHGCTWLAGGGNAEQRIKRAKEREDRRARRT